MYVWVDALNNYVTGCGFPDESNPRWKYWPRMCMSSQGHHAVSRRLLAGFLMSAGLPVHKRVFGHGFVLNRGEKCRNRLAM